MDKDAVKEALDKSIEIVANEEYQRLTDGLKLAEKAHKVESALKELEKLQYGEIPDYSDEWVALLYLTWYQPSHINLAYSLIKEIEAPINDRLHVVDFGCGALAMHFGVALAIADAIEEGASFSKIRIDSIDTSRPMIRIGKKVWKQFKGDLPMAPSWSSLRLACKIAKPRTNKAIRPWGDLCWISAIHAVYNRNLTEVQKGLGCLVDELNPSMWLTTTHSNKSGLLWTLWPTNDVTYIRQVKSNADVTARFDGICQTISNWRIRLRSNISNVRDVIMKRNGFPIREYLDNSVSWKWPNMAIMWYEDNHT